MRITVKEGWSNQSKMVIVAMVVSAIEIINVIVLD